MKKKTELLVAGIVLVASSLGAKADVSLVGTWAGRWDFYPGVGCASTVSCPGSDTEEDLIITSQAPITGGYSIAGYQYECYPAPTGCSNSAPWTSGTLIGNQVTILYAPSAAN